MRQGQTNHRIEVMDFEWSKGVLFAQLDGITRGSIQKGVRLPITLRPHKVAREFKVVTSIPKRVAAAPWGRLRATWPKGAHSSRIQSFLDIPELVRDCLGLASIVPPWPPQIHHDKMEPPHFVMIRQVIL